jgi:ligand-binding sensor domain-containing protein
MWITSSDGLVRISGSSISLIEIEGIVSIASFRDLEITRGGAIYLALIDGISRLNGNQLIPLHDESGLISNSVSELAIDPGGILWVETAAGVQTYDGDVWASVDTPVRWVYDIEILDSGVVWLAHSFSGASRWDGSVWQEFEPGSDPGYFDGQVDVIGSSADGLVCLGVAPDGVSCFDGNTWTGIEFTENLTVNTLYGIVVDGIGDIYVVGWDRENEIASLHRYDGTSWSSWEIEGRRSSLAVAPDGSVWLAEGEGGVFNIREGQWSEDLTDGSPIEGINDVLVGLDGSIWVATDTGAWRFDGQEWQAFLPEGMLISDNVNEIAIGADNTIWFGGLGLARFGP